MKLKKEKDTLENFNVSNVDEGGSLLERGRTDIKSANDVKQKHTHTPRFSTITLTD